MSGGHQTFPLDSYTDENISGQQGIPSGPLNLLNNPEQRKNDMSHGIDGDPADCGTNIVHRRGAGYGTLGNPRSHPPGSSETSLASQFKDTPSQRDVEAQTSNLLRQRTRKCSDQCWAWCNQIDFEKWYEWTAYYIPILEWLPQYECNPRENEWLNISSDLYF